MLKSLVFLFLMCGMTLSAGANSVRSQLFSQNTKQVVLSVQDVYFLKANNEKSATRMIVNGLFPNSCYSFNRIAVEHADKFVHKVRVYANVTQGVCLMVLSPYTMEGDLGMLPRGSHRIIFVAGDGTSFDKTLQVE